MENNGKNKKGPDKAINFYWIYGLIGVLILAMWLFNYAPKTQQIDVSDYENFLDAGDVDRIVIIQNESVRVSIKPDSLAKKTHQARLARSGSDKKGPHYEFYTGNSDNLQDQIIDGARKHGVSVDIQPANNYAAEIWQWVIFIGLVGLVWVFMMRRIGGPSGPGGQIFNIGKSRAQVFEGGKTTNTTFNDVAGLDEAKEELQEIVDFLKSPKKYTDLGAKIPKGALLVPMMI